MLLIETYIGPSQIHGIGLFTNENVKRGMTIWQYHPSTCQIFTKRGFLKVCHELTFPSIKEFISHSYIKNNKVFYLNDKTRFINHFENPNTSFENVYQQIAIKDIKAGDEITENYFKSYDKDDFFYLDDGYIRDKSATINYLSKFLNYYKNKDNQF